MGGEKTPAKSENMEIGGFVPTATMRTQIMFGHKAPNDIGTMAFLLSHTRWKTSGEMSQMISYLWRQADINLAKAVKLMKALIRQQESINRPMQA